MDGTGLGMSSVTDHGRSAARQDFLAAAGWADAEAFPLPGDASFRRYIRLRRGDDSAMLMDAPPPQEDVRPFVAVAEKLLALDYSAPRLLARDVVSGFLLLEDLGDLTYTRALADGYEEAGLYAQAIDLLVDLHDRGGAAAAEGLPPYDLARLMAEADLFIDWYLPAVRGGAVSDAVRQEFRAIWEKLLQPLLSAPPVLVLRDFHVDNMMVLNRPGLAGLGLLDFQDALAGAPAYDVVSLLRDARRDVSADLAAAMTERYLAARPGIDGAQFRRDAALLAAQRTIKILGIFARLAVRDHKPGYLVHMPRLWRLLDEDMTHPALMPLADWVAAEVSAADRTTAIVVKA